MEFKKLLQRLSDRLPVANDLLAWSQKELYPAVKYLHEAFNYNVEVVKEKLLGKAPTAGTPRPSMITLQKPSLSIPISMAFLTF